tara:strand:+ start:317 stop:1141 length:825 start_codon:yes stop_codon:yes gene_type:complete
MTNIIGRSVKIKKIETPICRIGSKRSIKDIILENSPKEFKTYIEPFLGSGYIYFYLNIDPKKTKSILNDKDPLIYETFQLLKKSPKGLIDFYKEEIEKNDSRTITDKNNIKFTNFVYNKKNKTDFEQLASNILQLCGTFSNIGEGKIYLRTGIQRKLNEIINGKYKQYMKNTLIKNNDFENVIKKYDNKDSFIFLDPPYEESNVYKFEKDVLEKLSKILKTIKGKFLLTVNDSRRTRLLFKDYNIIPIEVKGSAYKSGSNIGKKKRNELIIKNY